MIFWNVSPEILALGPFHIRWYGLLFAIGFLIGFRIMAWILEREKFSIEYLDSLLIYVIVGTVVGARLGHCLIYEPDVYLNDPIRILKVWEGGLASHVGGLGVMIGTWLWKRKFFKGSYLQLLDYLCIPTALISMMIRTGNFFNSEIIGMPSQSSLSVVFSRVDSLPRHPAQLYEAFSYLTIFAFLMLLFRKGWHKGRTGLLFGTFLSLVFTARFFIEFIKERQVAFETQMPLDLGQLLSIPFVLCGIILLIRAVRTGGAGVNQGMKKNV